MSIQLQKKIFLGFSIFGIVSIFVSWYLHINDFCAPINPYTYYTYCAFIAIFSIIFPIIFIFSIIFLFMKKDKNFLIWRNFTFIYLFIYLF